MCYTDIILLNYLHNNKLIRFICINLRSKKLFNGEWDCKQLCKLDYLVTQYYNFDSAINNKPLLSKNYSVLSLMITLWIMAK